jgi:predicted ATPase
MMRDPHRTGVEVESLVERCHLTRAVFFADRAATNGVCAAAGSGEWFEHLTLVTELSQFIGGGESRHAGAENHDAHAGHLSTELEPDRGDWREKTEAGHGFVDERRTARGGDATEEMPSRQSHGKSSIGVSEIASAIEAFRSPAPPIPRAWHHRRDVDDHMMRRFIITGAPGAGKTAIIRQLELDEFSVVEEAATDIIAAAHARGTPEPWMHPSFIDDIVNLQRDRRIRASYQRDEIQFHDRCAVCTAALATWLGYPWSSVLTNELERIETEAVYETRVFFIRTLGFVTPTEARRISLEDTMRFEKIHEETYRNFGFDLVSVDPATLLERVSIITAAIR